MTSISDIVQRTHDDLVALDKVIKKGVYDFDARALDPILQKLQRDSKELVRKQHSVPTLDIDAKLKVETLDLIERIRKSSHFTQALGAFQGTFFHILKTIEHNVKESSQKVQKVDLPTK
jgi:adenine-specific DNA glycosylase